METFIFTEVFLESGYMVLNGLKTSSGSYGKEELSIAQNRSKPPAANWSDEEKIVYDVDTSWTDEMDYFMDSIYQNTEVLTGNSTDALKVMSLIDQIYEIN